MQAVPGDADGKPVELMVGRVDMRGMIFSNSGAWQTLSGLFGPAENPTPAEPDNIDPWNSTHRRAAGSVNTLNRVRTSRVRSWELAL